MKSRILVYICVIAILLFGGIYIHQINQPLAIIDKIIKLNQESWHLDKEIMCHISFELAKEQTTLGSTPKYIYNGSDGNLWMGKYYPRDREYSGVNSQAGYQLFTLCGIDVPIIYKVTFPINGKPQTGYFQKLIPNTVMLKGILPKELSEEQIEYLQRSQVLNYLIANNEIAPDNFIINRNTGEIFNIDLDAVLLTALGDYIIPEGKGNRGIPGFFISDEPYFFSLWQAYKRKEIGVDFKKTFDLIGYIENLKWGIFEKLFSDIYLDSYNKPEINFLMANLKLRKDNLRRVFNNFYRYLAAERGVAYSDFVENKNIEYSMIVLKKIKKAVLQKWLLLSKLKSQIPKVQKNIEVVSCDKAWTLMDRWLDREQLESLNKRVSKKIIKDLKALEKQTLNINELLAINLYIEEVKNCKAKYIAVHPERLDVDRIRKEILQSYSLVRKNMLDIVTQGASINARIDYIAALAHAAKGEYELAQGYCNKAKDQGCEVGRLEAEIDRRIYR